ncbi:MAG: ABC transporter ATP-binding protein [Candidatus Erginobacter occultus]|nr:ABC transporter ATP-binding protein [Candidatus Erginobacter occultus]
MQSLTAPFKRLGGRARSDEIIWALKDVSFEVKRGEVVGFIGRNGAGKTTLLKILSRITSPTEGGADIGGRVGSLLEVGTGFHPELTGRENIYFNGSILGMRKSEIDRRFDEIVEFSGVKRFIDTPVKRYSSGMQVRLAFSVAAHLEPEILLVDEVLAVGDLDFQKKCLDKMGKVARGGRTVLFVSHNMGAVLSLCSRAYLLQGGRIEASGVAEAVVAQYTRSVYSAAVTSLEQRTDRKGDGRVRLTSIAIKNGDGDTRIQCSDRLLIEIGYRSREELLRATFLVGVYDQLNRRLFFLNSGVSGGLPAELPASGSVRCLTGPINITPGSCGVNVAVLLGGGVADHVEQAGVFEVAPDDFCGATKLTNRQMALCLLQQEWKS